MGARRLLLVLLLVAPACGDGGGKPAPAAATAAPAAAAQQRPFGEAPARDVRGRSECLRATGAPGELALGGAPETVELLRATSAGIAVDRTLEIESCAGVASRPNGAAVAAGQNDDELVAYLREPGGTWGGRIALDDTFASADDVAVAVSDRGDAIVAWMPTGIHTAYLLNVRVAVRPAGGRFGEPVTLARRGTSGFSVAISATGEAMVMWNNYVDDRLPRLRVQVATAPAGGAFASPVVIGEIPWRNEPALALAPDGRAIVALPQSTELQVAERAPDGAFGAPMAVGTIDDRVGAAALAAIGDGGAAAVAWNTLDGDGVHVVSRAHTGAFSPSVTLQPDTPSPPSADPFYDTEAYAGLNGEEHGRRGETSLALTPDGWVLVSAAGAEPEVITLPLGGTEAQRRTLPELLERPRATAGVLLADGSPALAYSGVTARGRTALHLGADGASTPAGALPVVTARGPKSAHNGRFAVTVSCESACDVAAEFADGKGKGAYKRLRDGGRATLKLVADGKLAPRIRVHLTYSAPNSPETATKVLTLRLRDVRTPTPQVIGLKAVRRGSRVHITWRTARPLPESMAFLVSGARTGSLSGEPIAAGYPFVDNARQSFELTFTNAAQMRWITMRFGDRRIQTRVS